MKYFYNLSCEETEKKEIESESLNEAIEICFQLSYRFRLYLYEGETAESAKEISCFSNGHKWD